jgi:peptidoglycan hydrolase-like protein with peptidoglycan-binding domain
MGVGIDVFSGNGVLDFVAAKARGRCSFVGVRAAYGTTPDSRYHEYVKQCRDLGIPTFAYLFLRFGAGVGSPEDQGQVLLDTMGAQNDHELTPVIDLEFPGGSRPPGVTSGAALEWFLRCYTTVKAGLGGADPGVYTSEVVWIDPDGMNNLACPEVIGAWSWTKYWPWPPGTSAIYDLATVNGLAAPRVAPPFAGNWELQQYMGDAPNYPGCPTKVDMNRSHVLAQGTKGGSVQWVQRKLKITIDGAFGPQTDATVRAFQAAHGLQVDGVVGLATASCLSRVT